MSRAYNNPFAGEKQLRNTGVIWFPFLSTIEGSRSVAVSRVTLAASVARKPETPILLKAEHVETFGWARFADSLHSLRKTA